MVQVVLVLATALVGVAVRPVAERLGSAELEILDTDATLATQTQRLLPDDVKALMSEIPEESSEEFAKMENTKNEILTLNSARNLEWNSALDGPLLEALVPKSRQVFKFKYRTGTLADDGNTDNFWKIVQVNGVQVIRQLARIVPKDYDTYDLHGYFPSGKFSTQAFPIPSIRMEKSGNAWIFTLLAWKSKTELNEAGCKTILVAKKEDSGWQLYRAADKTRRETYFVFQEGEPWSHIRYFYETKADFDTDRDKRVRDNWIARTSGGNGEGKEDFVDTEPQPQVEEAVKFHKNPGKWFSNKIGNSFKAVATNLGSVGNAVENAKNLELYVKETGDAAAIMLVNSALDIQDVLGRRFVG